MFRSKTREIVIPQLEHARLSGAIARHWGNAEFALPELEFDRFVRGVTEHDRGYPPLDDAEIGVVDEAHWLELLRHAGSQTCGDEIVDLIVQFHVIRLLGYNKTPLRLKYQTELSAAVEARLEQLKLSSAPFLWADRITQFCDNLSFDFCFEALCSGSVRVFKQHDDREPIEIAYRIAAPGTISIAPWPLGVAELSGTINGYAAAGYPKVLQEVAVSYRMQP